MDLGSDGGNACCTDASDGTTILPEIAWGSGPIQSIIRRKINIHDIHSAPLIDLEFGMILFTRALSMSMIPLSTTWVFLGLLTGRELALVARLHQTSPWQAIRQLARDLFKASVGVGVSIAVASSLQLALMRARRTLKQPSKHSKATPEVLQSCSGVSLS